MRRLAVLISLLVAGCGFHPLYMRDGGFSPNDQLATIYVPALPNREGQLLRQALQRRFDGSAAGVAKIYDLNGNPAITSEGIGILRDNSTTRYRMNGSVTWYLRKLDVAHTVVASGTARVQDGFNVIDQQYFALDMEREATTTRVIEALADQITQQLAVFLRRQAMGTAPAAPNGMVPTEGPPSLPAEVPGAIPQYDQQGGPQPGSMGPGTFGPPGL